MLFNDERVLDVHDISSSCLIRHDYCHSAVTVGEPYPDARTLVYCRWSHSVKIVDQATRGSVTASMRTPRPLTRLSKMCGLCPHTQSMSRQAPEQCCIHRAISSVDNVDLVHIDAPGHQESTCISGHVSKQAPEGTLCCHLAISSIEHPAAHHDCRENCCHGPTRYHHNSERLVVVREILHSKMGDSMIYVI